MKDRLMLLVAVVAGLVATALAFVYLDGAASDADDIAQVRTMEVLFTVEDLPANAVIDADRDLRVETINIDATPGIARGAVKASDRSAVDRRPISSPVPAGIPLLYSHLTQIKDVDLGPGMRAMAITVDRENLMGGILVPGDHVDLVVSYQKEEPPPTSSTAEGAGPEAAIGNMMNQVMSQLGQAGGSSIPSKWVSEIVLANVRVIAVGTALSGSRQAQMYGMAGGSSSGGSTITLELSADQALELIRVQANGQNPLTLLLRPEDTSGEATTSTLTGG
jgi:pilus assembly protein CpaB